jgi:hypothetical protein
LKIDARAQLGTLAEFVQTRPALALTIDGRWSEADREPTARAMLQEAAVEGDDFPELEGVGFFERRRIAAALRERAKGESGPLEQEDAGILERYVAAQEVPESRLRALAEARADAIRASLLELEVPPERIGLGQPSQARLPSVAVELGARGE